MNREEALRKFVRDNYRQLIDPRLTKQNVKSLRQAFFERNKLPSDARFTNYDVAIKLSQDIARARKDQPELESLEILRSLPFITAELDDEELRNTIALQHLGSETMLTSEDLRKFREDQYISSIEEDFRRRAEEKAASKLEEEKQEIDRLRASLEMKQQALEAYRSELDSISPSDDLDHLVRDEVKAQVERPAINWWKELGLESDPFSSNQGLLDIPESKYDNIVVQTPFIKTYIDRLSQSPRDFLGKTIVFLGEFGSGKTTALQLISYKAGRSGLLPVMAFMSPQSVASRLTAQFVSQVTSSIAKATHRRLEEEIPPFLAMDEIGYCIHYMELARNSTAPNGFLICVDGLHKPEKYLNQSLEFLQQLQSFQERLSNTGVPCGILVAGSLSWENELSANPSLSGSFYSVEKLPALAEGNAVEAVVRRINSFVPVGKTPPTIIKSPLRNAFQVLTNRILHPPTFRDYLDHVRDRFKERDYSSVGISLALHTETIETVQEEAEKSDLRDSYKRLIDPSMHSQNFRLVLRDILPEMLVRKGIPENDVLFSANRGAFYLLRKEGFIVPRSTRGKFMISWHLSEPVVEFLKSVHTKHQIAPEDSIEALFSDKAESLPREAETIYGNINKQLLTMSASWRPSWPEVADLLGKTKKCVESIENATEKIEGLTTHDTIENICNSLQNLIRAIMLVIGDPSPFSDDVVERFKLAWCAPENIEDCVELIRRSAPLPSDPSVAFGILHNHAKALSDLSTLLVSLVRGEGVTRLSKREISPQETAILHDARNKFLSQRYAATVEVLGEIIESKVRDIVFVAARCAKGEKALSTIPEDLRIKVAQARGHERAKRKADPNFLFGLSRSEYSKVIFQRDFVKLLFKDSLNPRYLAEMKDQFELLFSLSDRKAHNDRPAYFREHATEIVDCLKAAPRFCEVFNGVLNSLLQGQDFQMRKTSNSSVIYSFGQKKWGFDELEIDANRVEQLVYDTLQMLEVGLFSVPPLDNLFIGVRGDVENCLAILRESINQGLVQTNRVPQGFLIQYTLTSLGRERLSKIRSRYSASTAAQASMQGKTRI